MSIEILTREAAERRLYALAVTVSEEPRRGGVARLLERISVEEEGGPLSGVLLERGALAILEEARSQKAVEEALEAVEDAFRIDAAQHRS